MISRYGRDDPKERYMSLVKLVNKGRRVSCIEGREEVYNESTYK